MANIKSSIKSIRKEKKTRTANHSKISTLRTKVKTANTKLDNNSLNDVNSYADNLATKGIISKNKASRIKSRTAKKINSKAAA